MTTIASKLTAASVMTPEPVCVEPTTTIRQLARILEEHDISGAPVVSKEGRVVGIVSMSDLIRRYVEGTLVVPPSYFFELLRETGGEEAELLPEQTAFVEDFMTEDPVTVPPGAPVGRIARRMHSEHIHRVIVVDEEAFPVGIITSLDLLGRWPSERPGAGSS
jgi:CBS domain-containing protein